MAKKKTVPDMLPRERLTKKARAGIRKYASIKGEKYDHMSWFMVDLVLEAERMRRADLYQWLESKGYKWYSKPSIWSKSRR